MADVFVSTVAGVDKFTINEGDGVTRTVVVGATSLSPSIVQVEFSNPMMGDRLEGNWQHVTSYKILDLDTNLELMIVRTVRISATLINLWTLDQEEGHTYRVSVREGILDDYGYPIDNSGTTAEFTGQEYPAEQEVDMIFSEWMMRQGVQQELSDTNKPYLTSQDPAVASTLVDPEADIFFTLNDDIPGVDLSTVKIWVDGTLVYENERATTGYWVIVNPIDPLDPTKAYRFRVIIIDAGGVTPEATVPVRVYAEDLASLANIMDETYTYDTDKRLSRNDFTKAISVSKNIVMLKFGRTLSTGAKYHDVDSYTLTSLTSPNEAYIDHIVPQANNSSDYIIFKIKGLDWKNDYRIDVKRDCVFDLDGRMLRGEYIEWNHHRSKTDQAIGSLSEIYDTQGRTIVRTLIEAVTISDEEIGGDDT